MPKTIVKEFKVEYLSILDKEGNVDKELDPKIPDDKLVEMYKLMFLTRKLDEKAVSLQRQGRMGTYPPGAGEEACCVGAALLMKKEDWLVPHYRENLLYMALGMPIKNIFLYWMGDERANMMPKGVKILPFSVPIASHIPHAAGIALASKIRKLKEVTVCYFGDGATSEGDFHEALNFAGVYKLPAVFICENNGYAISTKRENQTASETIAQKAIAYGISGIQVDGNDVLAVYKATEAAMKRAREGEGATLIECLTYRLGAHTTADDPTKYRSDTEVKQWLEKCPIKRLRIFLEKKGLWDKKKEEKMIQDTEMQIQKVMEEIEKTPAPKPTDMFDTMYTSMTPQLKEQRQEFIDEMEKKNG